MEQPERADLQSTQRMPDAIQEVFDRLWQDVAATHIDWNEHQHLFGKSESVVASLNSFAPAFFSLVQNLLIDRTCLSICRLTDPIRTGGNENLVLGRLLQVIESHDDRVPAAINLHALLGDAKRAAEPFRPIRNKAIAHSHYDPGKPHRARFDHYAGFTRDAVEEALAAIASFMNVVEKHYRNQTTVYQIGFAARGSAEHLIGRIARHTHLDQLYWAAKKKGTSLDDLVGGLIP